MSSEQVVLRAEGVGKRYRIGAREPYKALRDVIADSLTAPLRRARRGPRPPVEHIWALEDVSFDVQRGEVLGLIGANGAGKSTLLKVLSRITEPTEGQVVVRGRVGSLLEVGTGFHPELTGRENIFLNGTILGMRNAEIRRRFDEIVEFAGMEKFLDTPVKRYSSGMQVRLAFAVAAHLEPEILLVDEVLAVGDAEFQKKCLGQDAGRDAGGPHGPLRQPQPGRRAKPLLARARAREGEARLRRRHADRDPALPGLGSGRPVRAWSRASSSRRGSRRAGSTARRRSSSAAGSRCSTRPGRRRPRSARTRRSRSPSTTSASSRSASSACWSC